jgi:hypothetical protein
VEHVEAILATSGNTAAVAEHEQIINEAVYHVYGLTDEEIAIIEEETVKGYRIS